MKTIPKQKRKAIALFLKIIIIVAVLFCVYKVAEFMYDLWGFEEIEYEDASHVLEASWRWLVFAEGSLSLVQAFPAVENCQSCDR